MISLRKENEKKSESKVLPISQAPLAPCHSAPNKLFYVVDGKQFVTHIMCHVWPLSQYDLLATRSPILLTCHYIMMTLKTMAKRIMIV